MTSGVPRSINRLCDTALLICMSEKGDKVTGRVLKKAYGTLRSDVIPAPKERRLRRLFSKPALAGGVLVLLLAVGFLGYNTNFSENLKGWIYDPDSPGAVNTHVQKPLPPVSEVKSEEISKRSEAEEKNAPASMPGSATPQVPGLAQESPKVLPKEGRSTENKDESILKAGTRHSFHRSTRTQSRTTRRKHRPKIWFQMRTGSPHKPREETTSERLRQRVKIRMPMLKISKPGKKH